MMIGKVLKKPLIVLQLRNHQKKQARWSVEINEIRH